MQESSMAYAGKLTGCKKYGTRTAYDFGDIPLVDPEK